MSDNIKIIIDKKTNLIGLSNISLSRVGNDVYVSNTNVVSPGLPKSFSVYKNDKGALESTGEKLLWDDEFGVLYAENIVIKNSLKFSLEDNAYVEMPTLQIKNEISFPSPVKGNKGMFATIRVDEYMPGLEKLTFLTCENGELFCTFEIDQMQRVTVKKRLNIKQKRLVRSSIGSFGDQQGDIAINGAYFYYCHKDYDGSSNIWARWQASEGEW